jgi:hypothetical protein
LKTNFIFSIIFLVALNACKTSATYLPNYENIDTNQYGSMITVYQFTTSEKIKGELIHIDSNNLVVLTENKHLNKECKVILLSDIYKFKLRYAKPPTNYGWTIPGFILLPFIHGVYSSFTMPLHLIVTISVTASGQNAFKYSNKDITFDQLKMFARFPQGLPKEISLEDIK